MNITSPAQTSSQALSPESMLVADRPFRWCGIASASGTMLVVAVVGTRSLLGQQEQPGDEDEGAGEGRDAERRHAASIAPWTMTVKTMASNA